MVRMREVGKHVRQVNELRKHIGEDFPPGLIHRGRGVYTTPEVIEPTNCDHYPESPLCGGNPFTNPFRNPLAIETDWGVNECGAFFSGSGTILGVRLPTHVAAYIRPECRQNYEDAQKLPALQPEEEFQLDYRPQKQYRPSGFDPDDRVVVAFGRTYYRELHEFIPDTDRNTSDPLGKGGWNIEGEFYSSMGVFGVTYPGTKLVIPYSQLRNGSTPRPSLADFRGVEFSRDFANEQAQRYWRRGTVAYENRRTNNYDFGMPFDMPYAFEQSLYNYTGFFQPVGTGINPYYSAYFRVGRFGDIFPSVEMPIEFNAFSGFGRSNVVGAVGYQTKSIRVLETRWLHCSRLDKKPPRENPYRHPKPPRKKDCCMQCCSQSQQQQNQSDALLRQILRVVKENQKRIGEFPAEITVFDSDENKPEAQAQTVRVASISEAQKKTVERVEKLAKIIGIDMLPITVAKYPIEVIKERNETEADSALEDIVENVIDWAKGMFDWIKPDETIKITSLVQYIDYQHDVDSLIRGKWHSMIRIEDNDPDTPGNQTVVIPITDQAMAFREMMVNQLNLQKGVGLMTDCIFKLLVEVASLKKEAIETQMTVKEISQFLDYGGKHEAIDVPIQISPQGEPIEESIPDDADEATRKSIEDSNQKAREAAQNLRKWLEPGTVKAVYFNWDGTNSLSERLMQIAISLSQR